MTLLDRVPAVWLPDVPATDLTTRVRTAFEAAFDDPTGRYYENDWQRATWVAGRLRTGGSFLDVGVGAGQFIGMVGISGSFARVAGVDRVRNRWYLAVHPSIEEHRCSIEHLPFDDDSFDVVTCMEVLEHLPEPIFEPGIAELRRVCRGQLLMTVPYREPEPMYATHVRRFEDDDLLDLFPDASFTLLDRPNRPWMLIEERFDGSVPTNPDVTSHLRRRLDALRDENERMRRDNTSLRSRAERLESRLEAVRRERDRLKRRRVVRAADRLGDLGRQVLGRLPGR